MLTATTGEGKQRTVRFDALPDRVWVVVMVQPDFRPYVRVSTHKPQWAA